MLEAGYNINHDLISNFIIQELLLWIILSEKGFLEEKNELLWQAPPPPIVGFGSGSSLQSPRLTPRRISAAIPLAAEL